LRGRAQKHGVKIWRVEADSARGQQTRVYRGGGKEQNHSPSIREGKNKIVKEGWRMERRSGSGRELYNATGRAGIRKPKSPRKKLKGKGRQL